MKIRKRIGSLLRRGLECCLPRSWFEGLDDTRMGPTILLPDEYLAPHQNRVRETYYEMNSPSPGCFIVNNFPSHNLSGC